MLDKAFLNVFCQAGAGETLKSAPVLKVKMESGHGTHFHPGGLDEKHGSNTL